MARRLRIQYSGAVYHIINRGNYRADVFGGDGAAAAFERVLADTCDRFQWWLHAYVIMRNHFHLAIETPDPNLVEGMHWLQSTYATRFNRLRGERGHLFQGRYQALLIENDAALVRVVDYIHLNPVRAKIVPPEQVADFQWSSLARFLRGEQLGRLTARRWLGQWGLGRSTEDWHTYLAKLVARGRSDAATADREELCGGWAIGTAAWRKAIAMEHVQLAASPGYSAIEIKELREARWSRALAEVLGEMGRSESGAIEERKGAEWKCEAAARLRERSGAAHGWIAQKLHMGRADSVRSLISRRKSADKNQQYSA